MGLQLKKVYFSEQLSEETNAFTADVYYKNKLVGHAKNDGHGGSTFVHSASNLRGKFNEASEYAKTLPDIVIDKVFEQGQFTLIPNLENQVDLMFTKWLEKKELTKNSNKGIYYQEPDGKRYISSWKGLTIAKLKKSQAGISVIKEAINKHKSLGNVILNTNLGDILE